MLRARRATAEARRIFERKLVFSIVAILSPPPLLSLSSLLIQCNELIVIRELRNRAMIFTGQAVFYAPAARSCRCTRDRCAR